MNIPDAYPEQIRSALQRLHGGIAKANITPAALIVFGSLAKGTHVSKESDVNLAIVLEDASPNILHELHESLRAAFRSVRLIPFILESSEIPNLLDVFPVKIREIQKHHHVLLGEDPFRNLSLDPKMLRLRTEQLLRNHLIRLRRQASFAGHDTLPMAKALYASYTSLSVELSALLEASGRDVTATSLKDIGAQACDAFDFDPRALKSICDFKSGSALETPEETFDKLMGLVKHAVSIADNLESA